MQIVIKTLLNDFPRKTNTLLILLITLKYFRSPIRAHWGHLGPRVDQKSSFLADTPLSPMEFQIYQKWSSPDFCFSISRVYRGYKINKTKKKCCQVFFYGDWKIVTSQKCKKANNSWKLETYWKKHFEKALKIFWILYLDDSSWQNTYYQEKKLW